MMRLCEHDVSTLRQALVDWGHNPVHARRVLRMFYGAAGSDDFASLTCPPDLRRRLRDSAALASRIVRRHVAADGTRKLLIDFDGSGAVEAVLMPGYRHGVAAGCISSQIGCAMGCDFCASTRGGLERSLTIAEIVEQFLHLRREATSIGRKLKTMVFMGMGEPLLNLDNVIAAVKRIADPDMGAIGWRQMTVSTVGVVPGIERLTRENLNIQLALSLHAPDDETRSCLVPSNRRYPVGEIMRAARDYQRRVRRVVNIEYCLLAGVNDSPEQAALLAELMQGFRAHVNLIPFNPIGAGISGRIYERPTPEAVIRFLAVLRERGVVAHLRDARGDDVSAACGQLRATSP